MRKHTLIITEKPDAARRIASAIDFNGTPKKMFDNGVPYYMATRDKKIVVVPSLGHLYTVSPERKEGSSYPVFNFRWVPLFLAERRALRIRAWLQAIVDLSRDADAFIDACDYDMEGSVIGYCILKYACGNREGVSRRMKYSTLTREELEKSYVESLPHLDFALIEAGMARHEVDWLYGVNLTRALTIAARNWSGRYSTLSTGRVQGPLLRFLVSREEAIRTFVPTPYWRIKANLKVNGQPFVAELENGSIENKNEADCILKACIGTGQIEKVETKQLQQLAPVPFDLGALQVEAYSLFRYDPRKTLDIAQSLYLSALISYPRTSSQKLPETINYRLILENLSNNPEYKTLVTDLLAKPQLKPREGSRDDPAHPAIYPTGKQPEHPLNRAERSIWDLIVRRFIAVFGKPSTIQTVNARIEINGYFFRAKGKQTLQKGWKQYYEPYVKSEDVLLPPLKDGQRVDFKKAIAENGFTKPPPRYNPSSLLQKMEATGIGTKTTRADIIRTLYERKYVQNERMTVTDLGLEVFETLKDHCPTIVSVGMTKELEDRINRIYKRGEKREDLLAEAVRILRPVLAELKQKQEEIGKRLSNASERTRLEESTIGACPVCKTGKLVVIRSRRTGKRFVGCTNYFTGLCGASFALPQRGTIKTRGGSCTKCSWPTVQVRTRGRRTWALCFNPDCASKEKGRKRGSEVPNMEQRSSGTRPNARHAEEAQTLR